MRFKISGQYREVEEDLWNSLEGPKPTTRFECDGCSGSPDVWRGARVWPACIIHDYQYKTGVFGRDWAGRRASDWLFMENLYKCARYDGLSIPTSTRVAALYWRGVRFGGAGYYSYEEGEEPESLWSRLRESTGIFRKSTLSNRRR